MEQVFTVSLLDGGPKQNGVRSPYIRPGLHTYIRMGFNIDAGRCFKDIEEFTGGSVRCLRETHVDETKKHDLPLV